MARFLLLAAAAYFASLVPVPAADLLRGTLPPDLPLSGGQPSWGGLYVGAHLGGVLSGSTGPLRGANSDPCRCWSDMQARPAGAQDAGAVLGLQAGWNWQSQALLLGIEVDFSMRGGAEASGTFTDPDSHMLSYRQRAARNLASIRPRIGYAWNSLLVYATAGAAYRSGDSVEILPLGWGGGAWTQNRSGQFGWQAGVGLERQLFEDWSVRAEYLFSSFQRKGDALVNPSVGFVTFEAPRSGTLHSLRIGMNYRFSSLDYRGPIRAAY